VRRALGAALTEMPQETSEVWRMLGLPMCYNYALTITLELPLSGHRARSASGRTATPSLRP